MKRNVLVFPCGSEIGLEVYKSLHFSTHFKLFGGSSIDDHGKFIYKNYIDNIPFVDAVDFIDKLNEIIEIYHIDFIVPTHDSVVLKLAQESAKGDLGCVVITSPVATCEVARSKLKTYETLKGIVPTPHIHKNIKAIAASDFPVFLKPEIGQGTKGTYLAKSRDEVEFHIKKDPTLNILEYLPGKEYTIDCFTNKDSKLLFCEGRERIRISGGISVNSASVKDARFNDLGAKLNSHLDFKGVWFFQVKENTKGDLVLMEIAPRVAGTMGLVRCKGVNLPLLSLFDAMGLEVDIIENNYSIVIDRALQNIYKHNLKYSNVYIDLDDLIIFEGKVNTDVVAFLFQCINKKINIHLLTKHKDNLKDTLHNYKLSGIFDELILVDDEVEKFSYIKAKDAIFIDDSFAERKKVHDVCNIPVFDASMLEGLMEGE